jgi:hypothetical protein
MLVARVSVLVADQIRAKNFYSGKLNFAAGDHSATHHPRSSFAPRTFRSPVPSATAQFDVTWPQKLRLPETQPPFYSIHDSRAQDLLASEVVAFAHIDIGWHSPKPNEAEND